MLTALNPLLDLVFPPRCPLCTGAVATHGGLCGACWKKLVPPASPACRLCQLPLDASDSPFDAPLEDAEVCVMPFDRIEELSREVNALQRHVHKIMSAYKNHSLCASLFHDYLSVDAL